MPTAWLLEALKITEKIIIGRFKNNREIIQENAFEQKKKKPGLNLTPG